MTSQLLKPGQEEHHCESCTETIHLRTSDFPAYTSQVCMIQTLSWHVRRPWTQVCHRSMPKINEHTALLLQKTIELSMPEKIINTNKQCLQKWADKNRKAEEKISCHLCQHRLGNCRQQGTWKSSIWLNVTLFIYQPVRWREREERGLHKTSLRGEYLCGKEPGRHHPEPKVIGWACLLVTY